MNAPGETHTIQLELRLDGTALTGEARVPGDLPRAFSGWVGLVRVVENAGAAAVTLTQEDLDTIHAALPHGGFGSRYPEAFMPKG